MPIKVPSKSAIKPIELGKIYVLLKYRSNILKVLYIIELDYFVFVHLEIDLHYYCGWTVYIKSKISVFQNKVYITLTIPFSK